MTVADRDHKGRFAPGNAGGPGNPLGGQVARLRAALITAVTAEQIAELARALLAQALDGDVGAAKLVLSYTIGRPVEHDLLERLEALEERVT